MIYYKALAVGRLLVCWHFRVLLDAKNAVHRAGPSVPRCAKNLLHLATLWALGVLPCQVVGPRTQFNASRRAPANVLDELLHFHDEISGLAVRKRTAYDDDPIPALCNMKQPKYNKSKESLWKCRESMDTTNVNTLFFMLRPCFYSNSDNENEHCFVLHYFVVFFCVGDTMIMKYLSALRQETTSDTRQQPNRPSTS